MRADGWRSTALELRIQLKIPEMNAIHLELLKQSGKRFEDMPGLTDQLIKRFPPPR